MEEKERHLEDEINGAQQSPNRPEPPEEEPMEWQPPMQPAGQSSSRASFDMGSMGKMAAVALVVAVVVIMFLGMVGGGSFVTKKDFETNMTNMATSINEATAAVNNAVENLPNTVSSTVNNAMAQQTASLQTSINQVNGTVADLESSVSALSSKIDQEAAAREKRDNEIVAVLTEQGVRITALETAEEEEEVTEEEASTDIKDNLEIDMGYSQYFTFSENTTVVEQSLYFEVVNESDYDLENVEVELVLHSRGVPIALDGSLCDVTSGYPLQWQPIYVGNGVMVLKGITPSYTSGLEIDSDDGEDVMVTIELGVAEQNKPINNVRFYVEGKVTDYDIVE